MTKPIVIPAKDEPTRAIFDAGVEAGRQEMKSEILSHLLAHYMHPSIARGSDMGVALLAVAKSISKELV